MKNIKKYDPYAKYVVIDIDNTLTDFQYTLVHMASILDCDTCVVNDVTEYNFTMHYGLTREQAGEFWSVYESELASRALFAKDRYSYILENYVPKNSKILLVSARPQNLTNVTEQWLEENDIYFDELHCIGHGIEKENYILDVLHINPYAIFEDKPQVLNGMYEKSNALVYCIDYPYNQDAMCHHRLDRNTGQMMN